MCSMNNIECIHRLEQTRIFAWTGPSKKREHIFAYYMMKTYSTVFEYTVYNRLDQRGIVL